MTPYHRVRSRGAFMPLLAHATSYNIDADCSGTIVQTADVADAVRVGVFETMDDFVVPQFRRRQAKGEVFFNPLTYTKRESVVDLIGSTLEIRKDLPSCSSPLLYNRVTWAGPIFARRLNGNNPSQPIPLSTSLFDIEEVVGMEEEVSTKCLAKRGMADSNLFESVAEYRQTLSLLKSPIKGFWRFLSKNESAIRKASRVGDAWLIYRYGVLPLVKDVEGIISGLKQKVGLIRPSSRAQLISSKSMVLPGSFSNDAFGTTVHYSITKNCSVSVRALSLDEYVVSQFERIGFTSKGLLTVPYQLIPYSFVADWFVNLGDYLEALVPLPSVKQLGSCVTTRRADSYIYDTISTVPGYGYTVLSPLVSRVSASYLAKTRKPLAAPTLGVKHDFKFHDAVRLADSAALIGQKLASLFGRR